MEELLTFVSIDIADDKLRRKAVTMLLDYGLVREHYSVFSGMMTRNRREELFVRMRARLGAQGAKFGRILVIPVNSREAAHVQRCQIGHPGVKKVKPKPNDGPRDTDDERETG